jgi:hypothetical protein
LAKCLTRIALRFSDRPWMVQIRPVSLSFLRLQPRLDRAADNGTRISLFTISTGAPVCFSRLELTLHGSPALCLAAVERGRGKSPSEVYPFAWFKNLRQWFHQCCRRDPSAPAPWLSSRKKRDGQHNHPSDDDHSRDGSSGDLGLFLGCVWSVHRQFRGSGGSHVSRPPVLKPVHPLGVVASAGFSRRRSTGTSQKSDSPAA